MRHTTGWSDECSEQAFHELFDEWMPTVLGWCTRLGGSRVDAEDAAHDVFLVVLRRVHTVRDQAAMPAWLFGVTRRVLAAHRRRAWLRRWVPGASPEGRSDCDPGRDAIDRELHERVHAAVLALPRIYREVILLGDLEERSDAEVAVILGIPRETVKTRRRRGRQRMRRALDAYAKAAFGLPARVGDAP